MAYNRWRNGSPSRTYHGVWAPNPNRELYHYGVKGMKWRNHKGLQIEAHEATISGGSAPTDENGGPKWYDESQQRSEQEQADAAYQRYQEIMEARKPAWQKKWEKSSVKQAVDKIIAKIKGSGKTNRPRSRKRNKTGGGKGVLLRKKALGGEVRVY